MRGQGILENSVVEQFFTNGNLIVKIYLNMIHNNMVSKSVQ